MHILSNILTDRVNFFNRRTNPINDRDQSNSGEPQGLRKGRDFSHMMIPYFLQNETYDALI